MTAFLCDLTSGTLKGSVTLSSLHLLHKIITFLLAQGWLGALERNVFSLKWKRQVHMFFRNISDFLVKILEHSDLWTTAIYRSVTTWIFHKRELFSFVYLLSYHAVAIHKLYFTIDFAIAIFMEPMIYKCFTSRRYDKYFVN
jgi:hypothetical protein